MNQDSRKRKQYIVDRKFQIKFIFRLVMLELFAVLISGFVSAFFVFYTFHRTTASTGLWGETLIYNIAILIGVLAVWIIWRGIIHSHRIAGPAYRMAQAMKQIEDNQMDTRINFRKKDEFRPIADSFNSMMDSITKRQQEARTRLEHALESLDANDTSSAKEHIQRAIELLGGVR